MGRGAYKSCFRCFAALSKFGIFGQESITRMNGLGTGFLGSRNDPFDIEIAFGWFGLSQ